MFKQLQGLNDSRGQNVVNQFSLTRDKQSPMAQFGLLNNGIRVRDPSQMFVFGNCLGTKNYKNMFSKTENSIASSGNNVVPKSEPDDAFTPSCDNDGKNNSNASHSPYVGLRLTTQSQSLLVNYADPSWISQQTGHFTFTKPSQSPKIKNKQLSVKKEGGQRRRSTRPVNLCLGAPVLQKFSITGLPSTSHAANRRIRNPSSKHLQQLDVAANQNTRLVKTRKRKVSTFEEMADSFWMSKRKKRVSLTTELMQLLIQLPPAIVLSEDAIKHCDIVTYYASKLALDEEYHLCSPTGKNMTCESSSNQDLIKVIKGFIDRSKQLEVDIVRLEKRESKIREVMMDCQDLEKISFVNRFAKFNARRPAATSDRSSSTMLKPYPQKCVKAIPMPKMVPEGQNCLFL